MLGGVGADVPLADAERPLQRVEDVVSLAVVRPVLPGASVIIAAWVDAAGMMSRTASSARCPA
ncbi:MAG: hypothetical protein EXR73_14705 [Myxococcales bacterium]|nr:hypothetical protein [Myxococcales bacterium]